MVGCCICKYFPPSCEMSFHFVYGFHCCAESLLFSFHLLFSFVFPLLWEKIHCCDLCQNVLSMFSYRKIFFLYFLLFLIIFSYYISYYIPIYSYKNLFHYIMFHYKNFIVSSVTFRSLIHLKLIFVYDVRKPSNLIL